VTKDGAAASQAKAAIQAKAASQAGAEDQAEAAESLGARQNDFAKQSAKKARGFLTEFKAFALRGNVVDMAVGVVIGAAFSAIVNGLVSNIIMPLAGLLTGGMDFSKLAVTLSEGSSLAYGAFIQAIVNFVIIAFAIFIVVKLLNKTIRKPNDEGKDKDEAPAPLTEAEILLQIRDLLKERKDLEAQGVPHPDCGDAAAGPQKVSSAQNEAER
jgi:large conductance mechanosensitive channel